MPPHGSHDRYLTCRTCRISFLYAPEERQQRVSQGLPDPDQCPACRALERLTRRHSGRVERYDRRRGFGFIRDEDGTSVFLHASASCLERGELPASGMRVQYSVEQTAKGPRALGVTRVLDAE